MTPQDLIAAFDTLAEAPEGVTRLRELVLQLAVRGSLVPRESDDASVEQHVPVKSIARFLNGYAFKSGWYVKDGIRVVRNQNVGHGTLDWKDARRVSPAHADEFSRFALREGDIVLSLDRPLISTGLKAARVGADDLPCLLLQRVACPRFVEGASVLPEYFFTWLQSPDFTNSIDPGRSNGVPHISTRAVEKMRLRLPPLAEQKRIVARVDELMGLLDTLEAKRNAREATRVALRDAALAALRDADTPEAVEAAWARIAGRMDDLFTDPADVEPLRQAVLQLAVRGRLVPQDPADEPASALLARLRTARTALLKADAETNKESATVLRKLSKLGEIESPYQVPSGWICTQLLDASERVVDCHNKTAPYVNAGIPIVRTSNIRRGQLRMAGMKFITEETYRFWSRRCPPKPGDLIFTREAPMGEATIIPDGMTVCLGQRTMLVRPMPEFVLADYLLLVLLEPGVRERAGDTAVGMTVKHLRVGDVEKLPVMVPPIAEQERIVARVGELLALLDGLEKHLTTKKAAHDAFAAAAVHHLDA